MAKIAQISAKYIIHSSISIDGVVDRPDVIGAIFGQTEGLLGADLELRELQRSGRIGRIEVNVTVKGGKTAGEIVIPSSLDKAETAIVGAALEIIQRIGPCNAKLHVETIEDIRISKRQFVIERAKELLKNMMEGVMPDSQELADEVAYSVRVMEITEYGRERLPAGPAIDESDEIIVVEGRADVLNLLKHGFKNAIAINGTNVPESVAELCKGKVVTVFVDGDRGGDLIIKELLAVTEVDFITKAPDGKEVEELTKKEIHKSIRSRIATEQYRMESNGDRQERRREERQERKPEPRRDEQKRDERPVRGDDRRAPRPEPRREAKRKEPSEKEKKSFNELLEDLIGTRGAYVLDTELNILGKVPVSELESTIKALKGGVYAVVFDGDVEKRLVDVAEAAGISFLVAMNAKAQSGSVTILTVDDL